MGNIQGTGTLYVLYLRFEFCIYVSARFIFSFILLIFAWWLMLLFLVSIFLKSLENLLCTNTGRDSAFGTFCCGILHAHRTGTVFCLKT
jgi:hypothetical protein